MASKSSFLPLAAMFFVLAAVFSVVLWPEISLAAKIAFFATGVGCGIGIGKSASSATLRQ